MKLCARDSAAWVEELALAAGRVAAGRGRAVRPAAAGSAGFAAGRLVGLRTRFAPRGRARGSAFLRAEDASAAACFVPVFFAWAALPAFAALAGRAGGGGFCSGRPLAPAPERGFTHQRGCAVFASGRPLTSSRTIAPLRKSSLEDSSGPRCASAGRVDAS